MFLHRVPVGLHKELPAKGVPGKLRSGDEFVNNQGEQANDRKPAKAHGPAEQRVGNLTDSSLQQRRLLSFDFQGSSRSPLRFRSIEMWPGQGLMGHSF